MTKHDLHHFVPLDAEDRNSHQADKWEESLAPKAPIEHFEPPLVIGNIDMCKLRDLLFSVRDNSIYCPVCRCPEFSPNEMRSSHFEPCSIGEVCEKFLALYPRPDFTIKWRK
jgi:hypothetical protein